MQCNMCGCEAVFYQPYSGRHICGRHLVQDIEARAKRTIRSHRWMRPGDHIAVLLEGDRSSAALLCFMKKLTGNRRDIRLSGIFAGGDDAGGKKRAAAMTVAESLSIPFGELPRAGSGGTAVQDCISRVARAVTLDQVAGSVLDQFLHGDVDLLFRAPADSHRGVPEIYPFVSVPSDEVDQYSRIEGPDIALSYGSPGSGCCPKDTADVLNDYCQRHPATKYAILHLADRLAGGNAAAAVCRGNRLWPLELQELMTPMADE